MADTRSFDEIVNSFPGCEEELIDIYKKVSEVNEALSKLDEKYPVDGWSWEIDPNRMDLYEEGFAKDHRLMNTAWTLICKEDLETAQKRHEARLDRQFKCVDGNHEWISIGNHIKWCKFCGTICRDTYRKGADESLEIIPEMLYPDEPHFLPHDKKGDSDVSV